MYPFKARYINFSGRQKQYCRLQSKYFYFNKVSKNVVRTRKGKTVVFRGVIIHFNNHLIHIIIHGCQCDLWSILVHLSQELATYNSKRVIFLVFY